MSIPENTSKNTHNVVGALLGDKKGLKVLDIPSGAGAFTNRLMNLQMEVHSADIDNLMQVSNVNFRRADMNERLPYDDNFFDAVVCIDGIEHLENPFYFIRECRRVIKGGGRLILSTPNINSIRSRWRWFWTSHHNKNKVPLNENKPTPMHHINMMSYQRLRYILHTNGLRVKRVETNRVKGISWVFAVFVPVAYVFTRFVYGREEKDPAQRSVNREIRQHLFSAPLLFGETMIIESVTSG
jgi:2-polyprenyl-3-methyl-5-hydroxy-6-metoxy-1,4-benzoquinol methylase